MKLRFRAASPVQPVLTTSTETEALPEPVVETTVTTPTIELRAVSVPDGPGNSWGNGKSVIDGWVCALAPYPIGTGVGCYQSVSGVYTNSDPTSPSYGNTYNLPCVPYWAGGSCFEYQSQAQGSPACLSFCLQS